MSPRIRHFSSSVMLTATLVAPGCSSTGAPPAAADNGSGSTQQASAPADGSAAAPADRSTAPNGAAPPMADPAAAAPEPATTPSNCRMVPVPDSGGAMTCSEGCVLIKGAPIADDAGCALIGPQNEIALGCVGAPVDVVEVGACWVNAAGVHAVTTLLFPGLLDAGWRLCPDDYPHRAAAPCGERGAASSAAGGPGAGQGLLLAPDGSVVRDGSGATP